MTRLFAVMFVAAGAFVPPTAAQTQLWVRQLGTSTDDNARALAPDGAGGVFVAGWTNGSLGGPFAGATDGWFARYDDAGTQTWVRQLGTGAFDQVRAVASDGAGGVFVMGSTNGSLGGPNVGSFDVWLARYDGAGKQVLLAQFGTANLESPRGMAPDGAGGVFISGHTGGSFGGPSAGGYDVWLGRYGAGGGQAWIRQIGTSSWDYNSSIVRDGAGSVFVAGETGGSLAGGFPDTNDAWFARYDAEGNQVWIRQLGTWGDDSADALAPDGAGGVFVAGRTNGSLSGSNAGADDAWLARYDAAGNPLWTRQLGTGGNDGAAALAPDGAGGVIIAGGTSGSLGGPNAGGDDIWLARYDAAGNQTSIRQLGTSSADLGTALAPDGAGGAFVAGDTSGSLGGPIAGPPDAWLGRFGDTCYADCNADTQLNITDFICFQTKFALGDPYADCDGSGVRNINDFICFQTKYALGCP